MLENNNMYSYGHVAQSEADEAHKKKLDQHNLMKNPNLIVNDSVKLACDNLWTTIQ
jgi:hypothetical protein